MPRVGLLWRAEWDPPASDRDPAADSKLHRVFDAFAGLGVEAEPVVYSDEAVDAVKAQLLDLDGVLVWVNPIEKGLDRSKLDPLLREVSAAGVWVSAHPDVILKLATKRVLVDTKEMSWGTDTRLYQTSAELRTGIVERLSAAPAIVLKQHRGMGGNGVWKVELESGGEPSRLRVQHATRDDRPETMSIDDFVARCEPYFIGDGLMVAQPYQARLAEGLIRVYMTHDRVVGFTHQYPRGLLPSDAPEPPSASKVFEPPSAPAYQSIRARMETEWMPQLREILGLDTSELPVIWDADFLLGPKTPSGDDAYVLCEINASSTFAFPEHAMPGVAAAALAAISRS